MRPWPLGLGPWARPASGASKKHWTESPQQWLEAPVQFQTGAGLHFAGSRKTAPCGQVQPMAALEAMSHGLPCLLSSACNLPEAFDANAAYIAEPDVSTLITTLKELFLRSHAELLATGANGRYLTQSHFDWDYVARLFGDVYRWILGAASKPACVDSPSNYSGKLW